MRPITLHGLTASRKRKSKVLEGSVQESWEFERFDKKKKKAGLNCVVSYQIWRGMISRHPSLTPICKDPRPLHHYTHPFNLTSRWWLEACEVCVSMCAYLSLCVRYFSPYANHSLALRINLQMCHYPSGSAAITLQLHNSRLASWARHTHAGKCIPARSHVRTHTHAASTAPNKNALL